jgi:hypothetical protein
LFRSLTSSFIALCSVIPCRYAVAALAEYRPLVLQLGEEDVCVAAVASITKYAPHSIAPS